ncbi:hypothetical protein BJX63DRAFT_137295 [Aspergillus granulosus]|uniref:Uncharacterized protein n=1 Tax=Aspergillus granulosus TaxID=176169 RepID=A0ABR4HLX7_9EURO
MCCTVQKAPIKAATCSVNLCDAWPDYRTPENSLSTTSSAKREARSLLRVPTDSETSHSLQKRGTAKTYYPSIKGVRILAMAYPSVLALLNFPPVMGVLRRWFREDEGPYLGRNIESGLFPRPGHVTAADTRGLEAEHPIDGQVMISFLNTVNSGILLSGRNSYLPTIDAGTLAAVWNAEFDALAQRAPRFTSWGPSRDSK